MTFTPFDAQRWPRREHFAYFARMAPTGYSLTVQLAVTHLRETLRARSLRFYPAYLWAVTRSLNHQPEFKTALRDGQPGFYDTLTPLYAIFHEDDHTFSLMWTPYDEDFGTFYARHMDNLSRFGGNHGLLAQPQTPPPENAYTVSCLPWVSFSHFAVHSYDKPYYFPLRGGRAVCPAGWTHAAAAVRHLSPRRDGRLACAAVSARAAGGHGRV